MRTTMTFVAAVALAACGPDYERTEISVVSSSYPSGYDASVNRITLTEGSALTLHLIIFNDDDEKMPTRFQVTDSTVMSFIAQVDPDNYTVLGHKQGTSQLEIIADDEKVVTINVNVVAQPAPP